MTGKRSSSNAKTPIRENQPKVADNIRCQVAAKRHFIEFFLSGNLKTII